MKRLFLTAAVVSLLFTITNSWGATTVKGSKSNTSERSFAPNTGAPTNSVTSAFVDLTGPSDTQAVYKTPNRGDFILTAFCASPEPNGGVRLGVDGLGEGIAGIAQTVLGTACYTFTGGVSIPRGSTLTCSTFPGASPGSYFCMISGVQTK